MTQIDCTPSAELIRAFCAQHLVFKTALGEWIDNALDAGATTVAIELATTHVVVQDNGKGCSDLRVFAQLGNHLKQKSTVSGRYGVGAKDSALWFGGENSTFTIQSVQKSSKRTLRVKWSEMIENSWRIDAPIEAAAGPGEIGTRLTVAPCVRSVPKGSDLRDLKSEIGYLYSPAIKRGAQITIKAGRGLPEAIERWELPPMAPGAVVSESIVVNGKRAKVHVGIVQDGVVNTRAGITYMYGFRVIIPASHRGCGDYNPMRICGYVQLLDPPDDDKSKKWHLAKNKNSIVGDEAALFAEVQRVCTPILERARELGLKVASAAFEAELSAMVTNALGEPNAKAKRGDGDTSGTVEPKNSGRKHRKAREQQDGKTFVRRHCGTVRVTADRMGTDEIGQVKGSTVCLNLDNAWVGRIWNKNMEAAFGVAMSLIANDHCGSEPGGQRRLKFEDKDFCRTMGHLMAGIARCSDDSDGDARESA